MNKIKAKRSCKNLSQPPLVPIYAVTKNDSNDIQFELELCWCIQQLENALNSGTLSQKLAEDTVKNLRTLKSGSSPLIKKRQVMKASCGDYRSKMQEEERKMSLASKQIKFNNANKKANFVKKSAILSSGKDFRFNFSADAVSHDSENVSNREEDKVVDKGISLPTGTDFKFNFMVTEINEDLDLKGLSIK